MKKLIIIIPFLLIGCNVLSSDLTKTKYNLVGHSETLCEKGKDCKTYNVLPPNRLQGHLILKKHAGRLYGINLHILFLTKEKNCTQIKRSPDDLGSVGVKKKFKKNKKTFIELWRPRLHYEMKKTGNTISLTRCKKVGNKTYSLTYHFKKD